MCAKASGACLHEDGTGASSGSQCASDSLPALQLFAAAATSCRRQIATNSWTHSPSIMPKQAKCIALLKLSSSAKRAAVMQQPHSKVMPKCRRNAWCGYKLRLQCRRAVKLPWPATRSVRHHCLLHLKPACCCSATHASSMTNGCTVACCCCLLHHTSHGRGSLLYVHIALCVISDTYLVTTEHIIQGPLYMRLAHQAFT